MQFSSKKAHANSRGEAVLSVFLSRKIKETSPTAMCLLQRRFCQRKTFPRINTGGSMRGHTVPNSLNSFSRFICVWQNHFQSNLFVCDSIVRVLFHNSRHRSILTSFFFIFSPLRVLTHLLAVHYRDHQFFNDQSQRAS